MAKLQIKTETIATSGGFFQIRVVFGHLGLGKLIVSSLRKRIQVEILTISSFKLIIFDAKFSYKKDSTC